MKTFEQCLNDAAKEYGGSFIYARPYDQISIRMATEAAELYANEKLKGLLDEVKGLGEDTPKYQAPCNRIATRIEELINETK